MTDIREELLDEARKYKAELLNRMFGITAQSIEQGTTSVIGNWSQTSNIVGIGFGLRDSANQSDRALRVYVREKLPKSLLPFTDKVPANVNGMPTDVIAAGDISALMNNTPVSSRPTECGVSGGHYMIQGGTLGCLVKRAGVEAHERYILSNNHVLANCNQARDEDLILHPGVRHGGDILHPIAKLTEFERIHALDSEVDNLMDAAIAEVLNHNEVMPSIVQIGQLQQPEMAAYLDQRVCKYGSTTKYTEGIVGDISADFRVNYTGMRAFFKDQIGITWLSQNQPFSEAGDSGSVVIDCATQRPVGLLFSAGSTTSFATPIGRILTRFNVEIL